MIPDYAQPFFYQVPWRSGSVHAGEHLGLQRGPGDEFSKHVSLVDYPDARRLDLRQTLRDPYEQVQVRVFKQEATTPLYAVCDLSSSMQFQGQMRKLDIAKTVAASIACSAHDNSDLFGMVCYDHAVIPYLSLSPSHHAHQSFATITQLDDFRSTRKDGSGIVEAAGLLGQQKGLVFWLSDFHLPLSLIEHGLNLMANHQIIPVVLWDPLEYQRLPRFGFGNLQDPETGEQKTIFFRQAIRAQFVEMFEQRKQALDQLFARFDIRPLYLDGHFEAALLSDYFEQLIH
ncbi:hypothetical protein SAMN05192566_0426 [Methylophilus rhizosphaerae]|uniref:DUF58 domain-containing protein n=1 Tax=Methylophilus rhizosphaerae TaxID=492660 RepID=A0A1G8ZNR1_9PROT|nr:DUF58 domain-containing protein [Methylophilus rhizosphaerae]SDK16667.1 hypothetical protein SAMN05192566_0426 [Methylophilus rhizosphaerae]